MTEASVVIVDYGLGNLFNVERALQSAGAPDVQISSDISVVKEAERLVLPGVGAFGDGMKNLRDSGLATVIRDYVSSAPLCSCRGRGERRPRLRSCGTTRSPPPALGARQPVSCHAASSAFQRVIPA